jgi:putative mRNA 3-end processing factor|tara:strand:+ start:208 stop:1251 length:1044 start_codon:yes stop_codon:yes gene_type:complete
MTGLQIDVLGSGAVILGEDVTCDGFHRERPVRVQTHSHSDHMKDFNRSKHGEIILSPETFAFLSEPYHLDFAAPRANIHKIAPGNTYTYNDTKITLYRSHHMLGAVQVAVELKDGTRLGYSGDFSWPMDGEVIQVDGLVVDATYGSPDSDRRYTQEDAEESFLKLVRTHLVQGPVHIFADTGPLERALQVLTVNDAIGNIPVIGSKRFSNSVKVHRKFGYLVDEVMSLNWPEASSGLTLDNYIRFWGLQQQLPNDNEPGVKIRLTKYRTRNEPIEQCSEDVFTVGFSNHADFSGTIDYIKSTGASYVVTDGCRTIGGKANQLAVHIREYLGIKARCSSNNLSREWGM